MPIVRPEIQRVQRLRVPNTNPDRIHPELLADME